MSKRAKQATPTGVSATTEEPTTSYQSPYSYQKTEDYQHEQDFRARERLCKYVSDDIIGGQHVFTGPWGITPITYVDYVASAKALHCIEDYIQDHVLPMYANTHTEVSYTAQQTQLFREEARAIIKQSVNATKEDAVIFCGSGSTSAVNKLIATLNPGKGFNPLVLIGPYEHHSNMLPWMEIPGVKVVRIRAKQDGLVDLDHLSAELQKNYKCYLRRKHVIGSFSAGSNVTGILTDVNAVCAIMHKYNGLAFFDYACVAPYVNIDMNPQTIDKRKDKKNLIYKDAIFISTHKFLGGPGTPGLLIAKKHCFNSHVPHNLGGGTVQFVRREKTSFRIEIEEREEGGTPAIIESIRAGLVFKLKETFTAAFIMTKEEEMLRKAKVVWRRSEALVILGNLHAARLPIFPILIYNFETGRFLHHDFVAMVFNDLFGLQVRSGCSCAGPYSMDLLGMNEKIARKFEDVVVENPLKEKEQTRFSFSSSCGRTSTKSKDFEGTLKPGYVRLNLPYFLSDDTFNFVLKAVQMVADHAWKLLYMYDIDVRTGKWYFKKKNTLPHNVKHLFDVTFDSGQMEVVEGLHEKLLNQRSKELVNENKNPMNHMPLKTSSSYKTNTADKSKSDVVPKKDSKSSLKSEDAKTYMDIITRAKKVLSPRPESVDEYSAQQVKSHLINHELRWFMLPEEALHLLRGETVERCSPSNLPFLPRALAVKLGLEPDDARRSSRGSLDSHYPRELSNMLKYKTVTPDDSYAREARSPSVPWVD